MFSIRRNVFETNSSSTHSMAIPNNEVKYPEAISFNIGEFGWESNSPDPADYFYTAIACLSKNEEEFNYYKSKLEKICRENNIIPLFGKVKFTEEYGYFDLEYGYIDHCGELADFIKYLFDNKDKLLKFVTNGLVFTGNDNDDHSRQYIDRTEEYVEDYNCMTNKTEKIKNEYYSENYKNYEWHYKWN